jgi:hypothetical protein
MLGGDDLVLVCDAPQALPLITRYARLLEEPQYRLEDGQPLQIGVGVAIVSRNFPIYRAHELAEQLAKSAKQRWRRTPQTERQSVVDWLVLKSAWHGSVADVRLREYRQAYQVPTVDGITRHEQLILSGRPYPILKGTNSAAPPGQTTATTSLEALLQMVDEVSGISGEPGRFRSQLKSLPAELVKGRLQADWACQRLSGQLRRKLQQIGLMPNDSIWERLDCPKLPAQATVESPGVVAVWLTRFLDFLELVELNRLTRPNRGPLKTGVHQ